MSKPKCRLCGQESKYQKIRNSIVYGGTADQQFWQCEICDAIYLYPAPSEIDDAAFYKHEFNNWMTQRSGDNKWTTPENHFIKLQKREMPLRLPWLKNIVQPGMKVLEIGSATGFTLMALRELGCDCTGIEVNDEYAKYSRRLGIRVYQDWKEMAPNNVMCSFDLVLHYYVLEHVNEPLEFLKWCLSFIPTNGKMLFEVPCANDPLTALYKIPAFDAFYWMRAHHWYFTPKSLTFLLKQIGRPFEIYPGQRYDISNHINWMLTGKPGGMGKYSHIFSPETEESYVNDLKRSWFCDYLIVIVS